MTPPASRARITDNGDALRVVVPARRNGLMLLFIPIWLMGWAFGGVMALATIFAEKVRGAPLLFFLVWLCLWTAGGAWAFAI